MKISDKINISGIEYEIKMVDNPLITMNNQRAYGLLTLRILRYS
ncbi:hypothetical protein [Anaerosalibacter massiliensis]|uniref:Uncharacterized protein n=1 Tax=Anaerosalibacter massiliensis TaxID=1347392 RepID=A0A9X2S6L3_9FIRM|nr:hypothetical protein [Anaerosalibacter massiliensis]MCR2045494.1 hypothetical protein [Anaerosalibacter massiliensis]